MCILSMVDPCRGVPELACLQRYTHRFTEFRLSVDEGTRGRIQKIIIEYTVLLVHHADDGSCGRRHSLVY